MRSISRYLLIRFETRKYNNYATLIESFLKTKQNELVQTAEQLPEEEQDEFWDHFCEEHFELAREFPTVLRYSVFIQVYSFLEHTLLGYCNLAKDEFGLTISHKDITGNGIFKFQTYLKKAANLAFPDNTEAWKAIKGYNVIRNCIAHTLGEVEDTSNSTKVRRVISDMEHIHIQDSKITLDEDFCFKVLDNISEFLHELNRSYDARKKPN